MSMKAVKKRSPFTLGVMRPLHEGFDTVLLAHAQYAYRVSDGV